VKIDHKLKNRIRFNQLDADARDRLRRIYHLTSAAAALRIVQSGFIWSDAPDLCPNFTPNSSSRPTITAAPEVWLGFRFSGPAHLVPDEADATEYAAHSLYVHLYEWPDMFGLQGMRVARIRVSAPTASGLECIGFHATPAFMERCKTDIAATLLLTRLKRMTALSRSVQVPATAAERAEVEAAFPEPQFSDMEIYQMRFHLWRRRLLKRFQK
jgi:hypothetical protein